jgi:hypothetical protein
MTINNKILTGIALGVVFIATCSTSVLAYGVSGDTTDHNKAGSAPVCSDSTPEKPVLYQPTRSSNFGEVILNWG